MKNHINYDRKSPLIHSLCRLLSKRCGFEREKKQNRKENQI